MLVLLVVSILLNVYTFGVLIRSNSKRHEVGARLKLAEILAAVQRYPRDPLFDLIYKKVLDWHNHNLHTKIWNR